VFKLTIALFATGLSFAEAGEECDPHPGQARNACISNADVKFGSNAYSKYGEP
jgi:hypothetical protein